MRIKKERINMNLVDIVKGILLVIILPFLAYLFMSFLEEESNKIIESDEPIIQETIIPTMRSTPSTEEVIDKFE